MSFLRNILTVGGMTLISRMAGFVRDAVTAAFLGAGPVADAFFVALRLPNLFRGLFAEGAFSASFIPIYNREQQQRGRAAALVFAGQAASMLMLVLVPLVGLFILFMPQVMTVLAPGFVAQPEKYTMAVQFAQITFPYLLLVSMVALLGAVLNSNGNFGPFAAAPIAFNAALIVAMLIAHALQLNIGLAMAVGVTLSGILQVVWMVLVCRHLKLSLTLPRPRLSPEIKQLLARFWPGALGSGAAQVNLFIATILASTLPTGAVSYLYYAERLNQLPVSIIGVAISTALLPLLSRHIADGKEQDSQHSSSRALEFALLLALPAMAGLLLLAPDIIRVLFERGAFTPAVTQEVAAALRAYACAIPGVVLAKIFAVMYFARHDTQRPLVAGLVAVAVNIVLAFVLIGPLAHVGIAAAAATGTWVNALLLGIGLWRRGWLQPDALLRARLPRLLLAALGMAAVVFALEPQLAAMLTHPGLGQQAGALVVVLGAALLCYAGLAILSRAIDLGELRTALRKQPGGRGDLPPDFNA